MIELDERRIAELAKRPSQVLGVQAAPAALMEARKVLEVMALMRPREDDADPR